jgi:hypothetical protein
MQSARRKADEHIALDKILTCEQVFALHSSYDESGQIVLARGVEPGHFRGLPADQGAGVRFTPARHTGDYVGGDLRVELAYREIVEEEERRRALNHDVVDAVIHQILADRVVPAGLESDLQLGADSIG